MGQTLSSPATGKKSESGGNDQVLFAVSEMQGWRITMEDAHATVLNLDEGGADTNAFFAVYDGHGGGSVAKFAGQNVHKRLLLEESYQEKRYEGALKRAFLGTDEDLLANPEHTRDPSGCTAVAALLTNDGKIYVANAGDSRAVLGTKGEAEPLSFDHKPSNEVEKKRISGAGGYIEYGRVNGNLALSRALGDFEFKKNYSLTPEKQVITADPDVTCHTITEEDEFLVLACDGIWDCLSSQQVVDFVRYQVSEGKELSEIGEMMCDHCLAPDTSSGAGIGCDNMTVLIVAILHGRTKEEWYAWITDRVHNAYGHTTPSTLPQLYSSSRLLSFKMRQEKQNRRPESQDEEGSGFLGGSGLSGFSRVLGSTGGISFNPGSGILGGSSSLMFSDDDSDEDDSDDEDTPSFFGGTLVLGRAASPDPTKNLKAQLDEFEKDLRDEDTHEDGDTVMTDAADEEALVEDSVGAGSHSHDAVGVVFVEALHFQEEVSAPQKLLPNGDAKKPVVSVEQSSSQPAGDEVHLVVEADGVSDLGENPSKT